MLVYYILVYFKTSLKVTFFRNQNVNHTAASINPYLSDFCDFAAPSASIIIEDIVGLINQIREFFI
jgi:hypothetical protein